MSILTDKEEQTLQESILELSKGIAELPEPYKTRLNLLKYNLIDTLEDILLIPLDND